MKWNRKKSKNTSRYGILLNSGILNSNPIAGVIRAHKNDIKKPTRIHDNQ